MKRYISLISIICVMLLIAGMMTACGSNKADEAQQQAEQAEQAEEQAEDQAEQAEQQAEKAEEQAKEIGEDAALKIALEDAGLSESDVEVTQNKLDMDDGVTEYEIEFRKGTVEYSYSIEAFSGKILEKDSEDEKYDD